MNFLDIIGIAFEVVWKFIKVWANIEILGFRPFWVFLGVSLFGLIVPALLGMSGNSGLGWLGNSASNQDAKNIKWKATN